MRYLTAQQVRDLLRKECVKAGGQHKWAEAHEISNSYLSDVINGRRDLSEKVLNPLGLVERKSYVKQP